MMVFLLKLTICWGFFALLYALLLRRETFFRANRLYLLGTVLAGIGLAAFSDQLLMPIQEEALPMITLPVVSAGFQQATLASEQLDGIEYLWLLYFAGLGFMLLAHRLGRCTAAENGRTRYLRFAAGGCRLIRSAEVQTPFSFSNGFLCRPIGAIRHNPRRVICWPMSVPMRRVGTASMFC
ncbi:MAG: hypothetical protein IPL27_18895 [Lewinellaceae bacterium]|nr:hypothetical protein [Lewinellaceae bacterium]